MFILEIIALIFLCKKNGQLALRKGLVPLRWKWYTVGAWLFAEMMGIAIAASFYGSVQAIRDNIIGISLVGLASAFGGYLFIKYQLEKKPDPINDEIDRVGTKDLQPPRDRE